MGRLAQAVRILEELTPLVRFDPNPHFLLGNAHLALKNKACPLISLVAESSLQAHADAVQLPLARVPVSMPGACAAVLTELGSSTRAPGLNRGRVHTASCQDGALLSAELACLRRLSTEALASPPYSTTAARCVPGRRIAELASGAGD